MKLQLIIDHRFQRDGAGAIHSSQNYHHEFFPEHYTPVFDRIEVLARVADVETASGRQTSGAGVEVVDLGNWNGQAGFLRQRSAVRRRLLRRLDGDAAVIMITPGVLGISSYEALRELFA